MQLVDGIVCKLGLLKYQVDTNGHLRQAHVDHLKPGTNVEPPSDTPLDNSTTPSDGNEQSLVRTPLVLQFNY